jgi:integron integrase
MGELEIGVFLSSLATEAKVAASTQNQALAALLFMYQEVLGRELQWMGELVHAKRSAHMPVVLTPAEAVTLLAGLTGPTALVGALFYGAGLRLLEALRLRAKDVDFGRCEIIVRRGKGQKDRHTMLPAKLVDPLGEHLEVVRAQHKSDLEENGGFVELPEALRRKSPSAPKEWPWQWVFPATRTYLDAATGETRRHHVHETVVQKEIRRTAVAAQIPKHVTPHSTAHETVSMIKILAGLRRGSYRIIPRASAGQANGITRKSSCTAAARMQWLRIIQLRRIGVMWIHSRFLKVATVIVAAVVISAAAVAAMSNLALELAAPSEESARALPLVFRAGGSSNIYFKRGAVHLEIRAPGGALLRYGCADKRDLLAAADAVQLRPGETTSRTLDVNCYHPEPGKKYTITAVFDDQGDDFRGEPPAGAVWVTGPVRSNSVVTQLGDAHNKPLQADGASRRR